MDRKTSEASSIATTSVESVHGHSGFHDVEAGEKLMIQLSTLNGNGLGLIADFQFHTPPYNPEGYIYTDKLKFTADVPDQLTVQPVGRYITSGDASLQGLGVTMVSKLDGVFDSWWWTNRKWIGVGAVALIGLIATGVATKVLR